MIRTHVFEISVDGAGKVTDRDLGWCLMPEVPVQKRAPQPDEKPLQPLLVKVNGLQYAIIGHSWDITPKLVADPPPLTDDDTLLKREIALEAANLPDAIMTLFVQKIVVSNGPGLVRAPAAALDKLKVMAPPPGTKRN